MAGSWPFVGRREELEFIAAAMGDPAVSGLVVAGGCGVGKTSLLCSAVRTADPALFRTEMVVGTPATSSIPFGALAALLPAELATDGANPESGNVLRIASESLIAPEGLSADLDRGDNGDQRRLLLAIDNAQDLDDASIGVVHQLLPDPRAFVLLSVRAGDPTPEPITALWKDGRLDRLELGPLPQEELAAGLADALGGPMAGETLRRLWEATEGNLLYLREMVTAGLAAGALTCVEGIWRWDGPWVMAPRLVELVEQRIGRLDPEELEAMELLAFGAPIASETLTWLVEPDVLQRLEAKGLIWLRDSGEREEICLSHPLYGSILTVQCPQLRARDRQRKLANATEATGADRPDDCLRIATWRMAARVPVEPAILVPALRRAWQAFDLQLTERLARAGIAAGIGPEAISVLWQTLYLGRQAPEAERLLAVASDSVASPDLVIGRACNLFWGMDDVAGGHAILRSAGGPPEVRTRYDGMRAMFRAIAGEPAAAVALADDVLRSAAPDSHARALALTARHCASTYVGRYDTTETSASDRQLLQSWNGDIPFVAWWADWCQLQDLLHTGRLDAAERLATGLLEHGLDHGPDVLTYTFRVGTAQVARMRGRLGAARRLLREELGVFRKHAGGAHLPGLLLGEVGYVEAQLGNASAAASALREADALARSSAVALELGMELARPWVALAGGDHSGAAGLAIGVANRALRAGARGVEFVALHDVVRLGASSAALGEVAERLATLRTEVPGSWCRLAAEHADALARRCPDTLEQVARGFEHLGARLLAAEAFAQAGGMFHTAGRQAGSRAAHARAMVLLQSCEGVRTPAIEAIRAPRLTPRERDIARLAAAGMPTRDIAERLVISRRTVENHLHQVYAKFGVSGRAELSGLMTTP